MKPEIAGPATTVESLAPELAEPYRRLLRVLRAGRGMFTLVPVESNLAEEERELLFERLREDLAAEGLALCEVDLDYNRWDPVEGIEEAQGLDLNGDSVLLLRGLERTPPGSPTLDGLTRPPAFARLNQTRELLEQRHPIPTIVWCDPYTYDTLRRHAPDFFDHFSGLVRFLVSREESAARRRPGVDLRQMDVAGPREGLGSASAVRFYEELLEHRSLSGEERVRVLLGLAEGLVDLSAAEGINALEKASECAAQAIRKLSPELDLAAWSRAHFLHARALYPLGQPERALKSAEGAVEGYRELSQGDLASVDEQLARGLLILSNCFEALGRREEGLAAIQESVALYRDLSASRSDAFLPELAMSLNNLSVHLAALGRREEGLAAIEESVDLYRDLAASRTDAFLPDLAKSLNNLSVDLADLGHREEGLAATEESVALYRDLAASRPDAFLPDLARSLAVLYDRLVEADQPTAALAAIREALDCLEPFFRRHPAAFAPLMAAVVRETEQTAKACGEPLDHPRLEAIREILQQVQVEDPDPPT